MTVVREVDEEPFDLRPEPRIYPMLGEINLHQWRCLGELVDNSVDGFLAARRAGVPIDNSEVHLTVPMRDDATSQVSIVDNGPGMDARTLERAVRAGWTGNDTVTSLGMFGMGFNIATARLGTVTQVWSTRKQDDEWYGLEIDFDQLIRQRHFKTPKLRRPKVDPMQQGTEVTVTRLKPEQRAWFARAGNRTTLVTELGRAYSSMLRANGSPIAFRLILNGKAVRGRSHCVWGGEGNPDRAVPTAKYGVIDAYQPINAVAAMRKYCLDCWQWLGPGDLDCPACGRADRVIERERRVYGWLGVQRYLSANHYGIDFLRNGRKIEVENRDLFVWTNEDGALETEYPIDDPRNRGRIVGEIHIDHCRVNYMKDRFERTDPAWEEMAHIVRGYGPLRPDKAGQLGFGQNTCPLFLLFQAFRRSSPKSKVAGAYARLLVMPDNDRAEEMAHRFYAGEGEYQSDEKWWQLVRAADEELLTPTPVPSLPTEPSTSGARDRTDPFEEGPGDRPRVSGTAPARVALPALTREYHDDVTGARWNVRAYQVPWSDPDLGGHFNPWALRRSPREAEFLVDTAHSIFRSATMTPLDGLLTELAWTALDFNRGQSNGATFANVLAKLRDRYGGINKLDPVTLSNQAGMTLLSIARSLQNSLTSEDSRLLFDELLPREKELIQAKMASRSIADPQGAVSTGRFLEFAPHATMLTFFEHHPELFLDGNYWEDSYADLDYGSPTATELARARVVEYFSGLMADAFWLAEQDPEDLAATSRPRLMRAALANELLSPASDDSGD